MQELKLLLAGSLTLLAPVVWAQGADELLPARKVEDTPIVLSVDLVSALNPPGLTALFDLSWKTIYHQESENPLFKELSLRAGVLVGPNPAWFQLSPYLEWTPLAILQLRLQYDVYAFFGTNGALLSFPSGDARFGRKELKRLERADAEESGVGQRVLFQPTLRFQYEFLILRNQTDLAAYFLPGKGPFLLELEYDTLVEEDHGGLVANRTQVLFQLWKGEEGAQFVLGPQYELVHAFKSKVNRQRVGLLAYFVPFGSLGPLLTPRVFLWTGYNIQDRNRDEEFFAVLGAGFDLHF